MSNVNPQRQKYNALLEEIGGLNEEVTKLFNAADENGGEMGAKDVERVKDLNKTIEAKSEKAAEIADMLGIREAANARGQMANTPANGIQLPNGGERKGREKAQTIGEAFVNNADFKEYLSGIMRGGEISSRTHIQTPSVVFPGLKAITAASATSAGALINPDILSIIDAGTFARPLTIRDIITNGTTNSDSVQYVRQGAHTNNAATVAEATGSGNGTGAKPESDMALSVVTESVKTIAHWITATTRALQDAGQLRTLIDNFLRYGLEEELEDQILTGNGVGENFTGILNTSGTGTQAYSTSLLETTRKARTKVMTEGRARPTAYVMHPLDWEAFDLLQDAEERYYFGGPMALGTPRLWGLPVVESEGMTQGTGMVADWRLAVLWDRERVMISASNSHSDYFVRNLVAILAEMRAAFGVLRPAAFIEIDLTA